MTQNEFDFTGRELRDQGIQRAEDHANRVHETWTTKADRFFHDYIRNHREFMTEDVATAANGIVPPPPDGRAWGGVAVRAVKMNWIVRLGAAQSKNPLHHAGWKTVWKSNLI